jgi:hypothetical protein
LIVFTESGSVHPSPEWVFKSFGTPAGSNLGEH